MPGFSNVFFSYFLISGYMYICSALHCFFSVDFLLTLMSFFVCLQNFLRDLLKEAKKSQEVSEDDLIQYTDTMLQVFDSNKDGKLQLSEMAK